MKTLEERMDDAVGRFFAWLWSCLLKLLSNLIILIAFFSFLFAVFIRGCTAFDTDAPQLNSYDPKQRAAAAVAAAKKYGAK